MKRHASTIQVTCRKDGHEEAKAIMASRYETASGGNAILGGVIGVIFDASTGASSRYDQYVMVRLPAMSSADQGAAAARPKPPAPFAVPAPAPTPVPSAPTEVAAVPVDTKFNGEYFGHVDMSGASNLRPIRVRFVGRKGSGQADRTRCPRSGALEIVAAEDGKVAGEGTLVGDNTCTLVPVKISGRAAGNNLLLTFDNGSASREFTFDRR